MEQEKPVTTGFTVPSNNRIYNASKNGIYRCPLEQFWRDWTEAFLPFWSAPKENLVQFWGELQCPAQADTWEQTEKFGLPSPPVKFIYF